jgi:hypothetical protein
MKMFLFRPKVKIRVVLQGEERKDIKNNEFI